MARVFLSHAGEDAALAGVVHRWLSDDGHEVFLDQDLRDGIAVGEEWQPRLYERVQWADAMVCLVTKAYQASQWCSAEVGAAQSTGRPLLPVLAEAGVDHSLLKTLQHTDLTRDPDAARVALAEALRRVDASWRHDRPPFPGLRPFDIDEHQVFFGRALEVERLVKQLRSPSEGTEGSALLVVGPSGCGKSSLVRAGLVPEMTQEPGWWTLPPIMPGAHPVDALVRRLANAAREVGLGWEIDQVRSRLDDDNGLARLADDVLLNAPGARRWLLLVVDQFEELLTRAGPGERARFAELLRPALAGPVQVVGTLRTEFLDELLADRELAGLPHRIEALRPLHREALRTVIEKPARLAGIDVAADLVTRLVADTDSGDALPLLAFTLAQLADGVPRGGQLSTRRYDEELGGVQGALTRRADEALTAAVAIGGRSPDEVIAGLLRLVTVDEQGRPTRSRVSRSELPDPLPAEWDAFVAKRLLITDNEHHSNEHDSAVGVAHKVVVEVAHEAFLTAWSPLAEAIAAKKSALRARSAVEQAATEWDSAARPPDRLWERGQLASAVTDTGARLHSGPRSSPGASLLSRHRWSGWLPRRHRVLVADSVDLSPTARDFLQAGIRRDRYRRHRATTVLSVLLTLALTAAGVAVFEQNRTEHARRVALSGQLAAEANVARASNPRRAMLLALKAWQTEQTAESRSSLLRTQLENYDGDLRGLQGAVRSAAFSPDGSMVAAGGQTDGTILLWDAASGQELANLPAGTLPEGAKDPLIVTDVLFSPDGRTLVSNAAVPHGLRLWDVATRQQLAVFPTEAIAIALSPDGMVLGVGGPDNNVGLWDVASRTQLTTLSGHQGFVQGIAFSPDGRLLATAGHDKTVRLWDLQTKKEIGQLVGHTSVITHLAISPDGRFLASSSLDGTLRLWDIDTGQAKEAYAFGPGSPGGMDFSPDGTWMVVGGTSGKIRVIDLITGAEPIILAGQANAEWDVAFDRAGHRLVSAGNSGTVQLWQFRVTTLDNIGPLARVAFDPSGQTLAYVNSAHSVRLWDVNRRELLHEFSGHTDMVSDVAFRPDGKVIASASHDGSVQLWNLATGLQQAVLATAEPTLFQVVKFSPDGAIIVAAGLQTLNFEQFDGSNPEPVIWDASTGQEIGRLSANNQTVWSLAFAPDGETIAGGLDDGRIRLWNREDRTLRADLPGHSYSVFTLAYSPDGGLLAAGRSDGVVQLWDTATWRVVGSVPGFTSAVRKIVFSPDGAIMATASNDATIRLIDVANRTVAANLDRHFTSVNNVAFSPDGVILASAGADGNIHLWTVQESQAERRLCEVITRGATPNEWNDVGPDRGTPPECP